MAECGKGWAKRCRASKSARCRCRCGGANHGADRAPAEERGHNFDPVEKVGFVVSLKPVERDLDFTVGDVFRVRSEIMGNEMGARGVIYEEYTLPSDSDERAVWGPHRPGWSLVFENGEYSGFAPSEMASLELLGHCPGVADYVFSNVTRLVHDYRAGRFDPAFRAEVSQ